METARERNRRKLLFLSGLLAGVFNLYFFLSSVSYFCVYFTVRLTVRVLVYKQEQMAFNDFLNVMLSNSLVHVQHFLLKKNNSQFICCF